MLRAEKRRITGTTASAVATDKIFAKWVVIRRRFSVITIRKPVAARRDGRVEVIWEISGESMNSKERVICAVNLGTPDRVPVDFSANSAKLKRLMRDLQVSSYKQLLVALHVDMVDLRNAGVDPVFCGPRYAIRCVKLYGKGPIWPHFGLILYS